MKSEEFATASQGVRPEDSGAEANSSLFTVHSSLARSAHNLSLLKKYWGYDDFRGIQREIIESISDGHDTLGLMPTGGGKSITFQVPALAKEGVCIVITPLIALMKDQVDHLRQRGIRAAAIYTGLSHDEVVSTLEKAVFGALKLLYVSPERLSSELFQQKLRHTDVSFFCVDEAHCISQWGYDFRPSYLEIAKIRQLKPDAPVLALTATATPQVIDDIQQKLEFREKRVFRMSFERKNLSYVVRNVSDKEAQLIHILQNVSGSAIVYARSRQRTKDYAELLSKAGLSATYFHAGLDNAVKDERQRAWQRDEVRIMVATNAFGMGIDKPDVRVVVHMDCPDSIEAYFQEAGRAGRDGRRAYAVLLYNSNDHAKLQRRIADEFPEKDFIRRVYDDLAYFYQVGVGSGYNAVFELPIEKFCRAYKLFPTQVIPALKILNRAGYIEYREEEESQARVMFVLERDDLYKLQGNSQTEETIIVTMLRRYSGLFNAYVYIDEAYIAQQTGLSVPQVYLALKSLSQKHIISFIPQKKIPYVRYMQRREDSIHLQFPPAVYDDLKQRFVERIDRMLEYASTTNQCRSRMLLRYFGEEHAADCGCCDVCTERRQQQKEKEKVTEAQSLILEMLADGEPHHVSQLHAIPLPYEIIEEAVAMLVDGKTVSDDNGNLRLNR